MFSFLSNVKSSRTIELHIASLSLQLSTLHQLHSVKVSSAHLCSGQQRFHQFVVLDGDIEGLQEVWHKGINHLLVCFILLVDDLKQAALFHRSWKVKETRVRFFLLHQGGWHEKTESKSKYQTWKCIFITIESGTSQTDCPFAAFLRDLLLQPSFLEIGQVRLLQVIHELQFLLFCQHYAWACLANHLET